MKIQCHKVLDKEFLEKSHIFILKFSQKAAILKAIKFKTLEKNFNGIICGFYHTAWKIQLLYGLVARRSFIKIRSKIQLRKTMLYHYHLSISYFCPASCPHNCLKVVSTTFVLVCFLSLNKSTFQTRKNVFYFTSKAIFVLEKIKF